MGMPSAATLLGTGLAAVRAQETLHVLGFTLGLNGSR